jgi:hypothetical protein
MKNTAEKGDKKFPPRSNDFLPDAKKQATLKELPTTGLSLRRKQPFSS